ncbi:MAG: hypothetical protein L6R40_008301 [Gallowayella cf. fulva]|nr:MAG: hypothetical protein L6R40_008301 [Xanthomendoza cf. fulva]
MAVRYSMPSSHSPPHLASRKRKVHVLHSSEEEDEQEEQQAWKPSKRYRTRKPRSRNPPAPPIATRHPIPTPPTIALTPSPQLHTLPAPPHRLPTPPNDPSLKPALTHSKSTSLPIPFPECLPKNEEATTAIAQPGFEPSPPEDAEDADEPLRSPFEWVYMYPVDQDFGSKVCEAYRLNLLSQCCRESKYGKIVAREWKRGSTPEEAREAWRAEQEELERRWEIFTTEEDDENGELICRRPGIIEYREIEQRKIEQRKIEQQKIEQQEIEQRESDRPKKSQSNILEKGESRLPPRQPSKSPQSTITQSGVEPSPPEGADEPQ